MGQVNIEGPDQVTGPSYAVLSLWDPGSYDVNNQVPGLQNIVKPL